MAPRPPLQRFTAIPKRPFTKKSIVKILCTAVAGAVVTPLVYIYALQEPFSILESFSILMPIMGFLAGLVFAVLGVLIQAN